MVSRIHNDANKDKIEEQRFVNKQSWEYFSLEKCSELAFQYKARALL